MASIARESELVLRVTTGDGRQYRFARPFDIGRSETCHVRVYDGGVSRRHVAVWPAGGRWHAKDQGSTSGLFVGNVPVSAVDVPPGVTLSLGLHGPTITLEVEDAAVANLGPLGAGDAQRTIPPRGSEAEALDRAYAKYHGSDDPQQPVGKETQIIRQLIRRQRRVYRVLAAALGLAAVLAGVAWIRTRAELGEHRRQMADMFYELKDVDIQIAALQQQLEATSAAQGNPEIRAQVVAMAARRRSAYRNYDEQMGRLKLYDRNLTPEELAILHVTRLFGECDAVAPMEYLNEVGRYIRQWKSTQRFVRGVTRARDKGYTRHIVDQFVGQGLPAEFFYLALQESDFDPLVSGKKTRYGYAKGMWQFIPDTGKQYGLKIGPLAGSPQPDADDDRHKWDRATVAAAKYIKYIYSTDAQASGLLVMASYNWGEGNVLRWIQGLPANPRERNFWTFRQRYGNRIPPETNNYVFNIVAAAVIGSNPRLFGIDMDPPLAPYLPRDTDAN